MRNLAGHDQRHAEHTTERGIAKLESVGSRKSERLWRNLAQQSGDEPHAGQSVSAGRVSGCKQHFATCVICTTQEEIERSLRALWARFFLGKDSGQEASFYRPNPSTEIPNFKKLEHIGWNNQQ